MKKVSVLFIFSFHFFFIFSQLQPSFSVEKAKEFSKTKFLFAKQIQGLWKITDVQDSRSDCLEIKTLDILFPKYQEGVLSWISKNKETNKLLHPEKFKVAEYHEDGKALFFLIFEKDSLKAILSDDGKELSLLGKSNELKLTRIVDIEQKFNRIYEIVFDFTPQTIVLEEGNNGDFSGRLLTVFDNKTLFGRDTIYTDVKRLDSSLVKKLMCDLLFNNVEKLPYCEQDYECMMQGCLDADIVEFKIRTHKEFRNPSFECITGDEEENNTRKKASTLIAIVNHNINLQKEMNEVKLRLPAGQYSYFSGNRIVSFHIK